jgi:hypothetical protein
MFKIYSLMIFHVAQRCMLFYGQVDPSNSIEEQAMTDLLSMAEELLIGQAKVLTNQEQHTFVAVNHEDIITCMHVGDLAETGTYKKSAMVLVTSLSKNFKAKFQSDIDEFNAGTMDVNEVFGSFANDITGILKQFFSGTKAEITKRTEIAGASAAVSCPPPDGVKYPCGFIPPEQLDEKLFEEYLSLSNVYNIEMEGGTVSKNKVYIPVGLDGNHIIDIDYSNYPDRPHITLPSIISDILGSSQVYRKWNPENPARIIDLVQDLEQVITSLKPRGAVSADREARSGSRPEQEEDRLFQRPAQKEPEIGAGGTDWNVEQPVVGMIDEETGKAASKTPLKKLVEGRGAIGKPAQSRSTQAKEPAPVPGEEVPSKLDPTAKPAPKKKKSDDMMGWSEDE